MVLLHSLHYPSLRKNTPINVEADNFLSFSANPRRPALHVAVGTFRQSGVAALFQFVRAGFTTIVPLIVLPWILQWYLNAPSLSNFIGLDVASG